MLDPTTGTIYHVDFDPPPPKDKALIARLVKDTQVAAASRPESLLRD